MKTLAITTKIDWRTNDDVSHQMAKYCCSMCLIAHVSSQPDDTRRLGDLMLSDPRDRWIDQQSCRSDGNAVWDAGFGVV